MQQTAYAGEVNSETEREKAYTLTPVDNQTSTSITLYKYNDETKTFEKQYNELSLNKTTYGTGNASTNVNVTIPNNKTQTITVNYDSTNVSTERVTTTTNQDINSNFIGVTSSENGGAIYNVDTTVNIIGNYINNEASLVIKRNEIGDARVYGGTIYNGNGVVDVIGDFIGNKIDAICWADNYKSYAYGGAIYNNDGAISVVGDFINNSVSAGAYSLQTFANGGAIYNVSGTIEVIGDFINNYAYDTGGAIYNETGEIIVTGDFINNNIYINSGGAIYNKTGKITVIGDFIGNSLGDYTYRGYGSAIYNKAGEILITGNFVNNDDSAIYNETGVITVIGDFINNKNKSIYNSNGEIHVTGNFVGNNNAIYNSNGEIHITGNFIDNNSAIYNGTGQIYVIGDFISNSNSSAGSAIYNDGGIVDISGNFINNKVLYNGQGGAIYNKGTLNINAINNDITLEGNMVNDSSNAIYNKYGIINLNSANNHKIYINDNINGDGFIQINGNVYLNAVISENDIYIYSGILKVGEIGNFDYQTSIDIFGGTIDLIDGVIRSYSINSIGCNNGNLALDVDLTSNIADKFYISSSSGNINLSNINVLNPIAGEGKVQIFSQYNNPSIYFLSTDVYTNVGKIHFEDAGNGYLYYDTVDREAYTLQNVVKFIDGDRTYSMSQDETITRNLDAMAGTSLTIHGNGYTIDGNDYRGIDVQSDQTLTVNNAVVKNFKAEYDSNNYDAQSGGFINNKGTIENLSGTFENNYAENYGGVIYNNGTIENLSGTFEDNSANYYGGVLYNYDDGVISSINGTFTNNTAESGGAIRNRGIIDNINGTFESNSATDGSGGAIRNNEQIETITGTFINNTADGEGGAIVNDGGFINSISGNFIKNTANFFGGAIVNSYGSINITADTNNTIFTGNKDLSGSNALINMASMTNLNANTNKSIIFNDGIGLTVDEYIFGMKAMDPDMDEDEIAEEREYMEQMLSPENSVININATKEQAKSSIRKLLLASWEITEEEYEEMDEYDKEEFDEELQEIEENFVLPNYKTGTIEINNKVKNSTLNMYNGTLKFGTNTQDGVEYVGGLVGSNFNYYGGLVTLQNGNINHANLGNLTLHNEMKLSLDADLKNEKIDTISADSFVSNDNKINISNINLLSATDKKSLSLSPLSKDMDSAVRQTMADSIIYSGGDVAYGDIYKYTVAYDPTNANLNFGLKDGGKTLNDFSPAVVVNPVAQNGAQAIQMDSFSEAFRNMDTFMLMPENERLTYKYRNKYASLESDVVYDPTMSTYQNNTGWFRPYTTFENMPLKNGPKVSNVSYGSFFGYDSALHELGRGWDGTLGVYAGYTGSHQSFLGNSVYQNGGTLGLIGVAYKNNFFTGWTVNIGATSGSTTNIQGEDNFTALMGGISTKNGYNFELADGKVILQPSVTMSYSMVNTFDYTNASGVRMKSDPMHTLQLEPGLKVIGNIKGWQPYANVSMIWNVLNEQKITANNVQLPKYSVKPYVKYGVGLQKRWGDKFTAFGQAYVTNGGRNGVGLQAGLRIAIGDETTKSKAAWLNPKKKDTVFLLDEKKNAL